MATKKATENMMEIEVPAIEIRELTLKIVGDSPLICHAWDEKAKRQMLDKQMKKAKTPGREAKDPGRDFVTSLYWLTEMPVEYTKDVVDASIASGARFGFPAVAFKACAISGGFQNSMIKKTFGRSAFHIPGEMVEIIGTPVMREDMVKIGMGTADIRYRGMFEEWEALINIRYNSGVISPVQIAALFNAGGFGIGVGEWRPERDGSFGMFHVE